MQNENSNFDLKNFEVYQGSTRNCDPWLLLWSTQHILMSPTLVFLRNCDPTFAISNNASPNAPFKNTDHTSTNVCPSKKCEKLRLAYRGCSPGPVK